MTVYTHYRCCGASPENFSGFWILEKSEACGSKLSISSSSSTAIHTLPERNKSASKMRIYPHRYSRYRTLWLPQELAKVTISDDFHKAPGTVKMVTISYSCHTSQAYMESKDPISTRHGCWLSKRYSWALLTYFERGAQNQDRFVILQIRQQYFLTHKQPGLASLLWN